ncbi:MAG: bifunctional UDP-N-acetylglucosamine diphosphorylase/glucosamine-1-phosphate N-acetyltransferase GlmU [Bradymonadaceae bacterium]|nr:bifunctional UDP-N-acetylglucosamine diphosphorylase/glucosamine-1-phosphate N-acetyltransferase GlmU [Lujinxingiaceae bacterium]
MTDRAPVDFQALILAAGMGTRMRSETVKVLHEVLGKPMIGHVVDTALAAGAQRVVSVLGHQRERVQAWLESHRQADKLCYAVQHEQLGTAHAVLAAQAFFADGPKYTVILSGDVPNLDVDTLRSFVDEAVASVAPLTVMTAILDDARHYGRIVRNDAGQVTAIVEFRDASPAQRELKEFNAGIYVARTEFLARHLPALCAAPSTNAQKEFYLTDLVALAAAESHAHGYVVSEVELVQGVNNRQDLAARVEFARCRLNAHWMDQGVTLIDPARTIIEADVALAQDVILYPDVHLRGQSRIGAGSVIENGCVLLDAVVGQNVVLKAYCYITEAQIDDDASIGPFVHLRPEADIGKGCKIGNFVEIKKTRMDDGSKANHLTYLGDAHIGEGANVGAGTITCNYDGKNKHRTTIGKRAFIGSNTALVAPVRIGDGAYVGAGSVITNDVPDEALGVARGRQKNIEGWASGKGK